jgi:rhamnosyltransferase
MVVADDGPDELSNVWSKSVFQAEKGGQRCTAHAWETRSAIAGFKQHSWASGVPSSLQKSSQANRMPSFPAVVGLCIPTLNAGDNAARLIDAIKTQSFRPQRFLIIDSESNDGTTDLFRQAGATVHRISRASFNHGGTRQLGVRMLNDVELIIFLTQDAIPAKNDAFECLLKNFQDPSLAAAYGRQLPRSAAGLMEAHSRLFNYPAESALRSYRDRKLWGLKTVFLSNSFSAYRRSRLLEIGGFPTNVIMGEDTYVAAKAIMAGWKVGYCAEAAVFHSHNYTWLDEFKRYFDTGVFHAREPWIRETFGTARAEGWKFLASEIRSLFKQRPVLIPAALVRNWLRFVGFHLGLNEAMFPARIKRRLSLFKNYWSSAI